MKMEMAQQVYDGTAIFMSGVKIEKLLDLHRLCGFPPFMSFHGLAMSPGMRHKIRTGNYKFPSPSWDVVSDEAKELIKGLLKVVPNERLSISEVIHHPWIENRIKVPETPLLTADVLLKEQTKWPTVKEEFANALICMRIDYDQQIKLKPINQIQNGLLEKRKIRFHKETKRAKNLKQTKRNSLGRFARELSDHRNVKQSEGRNLCIKCQNNSGEY
uniref:non-specific serine/threonine protein kinase n=1 Tax=Romanomermis culicivorax TaxID=13658 RepID=A0A915K354_ROMCU